MGLSGLWSIGPGSVLESMQGKKAEKPPPDPHNPVEIKVANTWSKIICHDEVLMRRLAARFRFKMPNFDLVSNLNHFQAATSSSSSGSSTGSTWKGWVYFVELRKNGWARFPTGLLPLLMEELNKLELYDGELPALASPPHVVDTRSVNERPVEDSVLVVDPTVLKETTGIKLRDYQVDVAQEALAGQRGIIKCATGGGKTMIFTALLATLPSHLNAVILFRNKTLVNQTYDVLNRAGIPGLGRVHGDDWSPNRVTVATVQSAHKYPDLIESAEVLIADEVHEFTSTQSSRVLRAFDKAFYRWGFSATPFKPDDQVAAHRLIGWFGPLLSDVTTMELQAQAVLAPSIAHFYSVVGSRDLRGLDWPSAEEAGIVSNSVFHDTIVNLVEAIPEGRVMILVRKIAHGDALHERMPDAFWISGRDDSTVRSFVLSELRSSRRKKVVAIVSSIGFVGVDVFVHHLINAEGGKAENMTVQKIGRGLRVAPDKARLVYHDFDHRSNPYLAAHSAERMNTLESEGHPVMLHTELPHDFDTILQTEVPGQEGDCD